MGVYLDGCEEGMYIDRRLRAASRDWVRSNSWLHTSIYPSNDRPHNSRLTRPVVAVYSELSVSASRSTHVKLYWQLASSISDQ